MIFSDSDHRLVCEVADLWQERGGSADDFHRVRGAILEELRRREAGDADGALVGEVHPPKGTLLEDWGRGNLRILTYADGKGGTYDIHETGNEE